MTQKDFEEKVRMIYGNLFSFERTNWVNSRTPFIVTCKHGDLKRTYSQLITKRQGCFECKKEALLSEIKLDFSGDNFEEEYGKIINNAKERIKPAGYFERHHIKPKSLGGDNSKQNLVNLTPEEHYLAHYLLWKFTKTKEMTMAFWRMTITGNKVLSKEEYGELRRQAAEINSKKSRQVYCLELDKTFVSAKQASIQVTGTEKNHNQIRAVCNNKIKAYFYYNDTMRYHWCWEENKEELKNKKEQLIWEERNRQELKNLSISKTKTGKKSNNGNSIKCVEKNIIFRTLTEAAVFCNGSASKIKKNALEGYPYHGYHWQIIGQPEVELKDKRPSSFKGKKHTEEAKRKLSKGILVRCIETGTIFESLKEASESVSGYAYILRNCINEGKPYKGCNWEILEREKAAEKEKNYRTAKIRIRCIETGMIFESLKDAAIYLGKNPTEGASIKRNAVKGKPYHGYHWELL